MIRSQNKSLNLNMNIEDFTTRHYESLLKLASSKYIFSSYKKIPWKKKFILWRHDVDYSLNRSLRLAEIENKLNLKATYFINLHSEFYNIFEKSQFEIIREIIKLGHDIGLHLDFDFCSIKNKTHLNKIIKNEISILNNLLNIIPSAFSIHNPNEYSLRFDDEIYSGIVNSYSKRLKNEVAYCSDSNGYWSLKDYIMF